MACSSSGKAGAPTDVGEGGDSEQPICVLQEGGKAYNCGGEPLWPACPTNAEGASCVAGAPGCMGCEGQSVSVLGAGYECTCQDPGADGSLVWECMGTGHGCR
jgi:hypothetical protein